MKRIIYLSLMICMVLCSALTYAAPAAKKPWTFLVYLAAVNTLNDFAYADIAEMMKIGSNSNVNVIVYLSILKNDGSKVTLRLFIEKGKMTQIGSSTVEDSGDVETLKKALAWAAIDYPSDHTVVILWNHGGGALNRGNYFFGRSICFDDISNNYLTDRDCREAFSWGQKTYRNGKKYDVIACDACLMAMVEFAYALADCADYVVASQENIPGDGYDYARVLDDFLKKIPTSLAFTQNLVSAYQEEYIGTPDYTLSAIDTYKMSAFVDSINQLALFLTSAMLGKKGATVRSYIDKSRAKAIAFNDGLYVDVKTFLAAIKGYISKLGLAKSDQDRLGQLIKASNTLLDQCVIQKVASVSYRSVGGLSFYLPSSAIDSSYYNLYWTEKNPAMLHLLESYIQ